MDTIIGYMGFASFLFICFVFGSFVLATIMGIIFNILKSSSKK